MSVHRYPPAAIAADYARAGTGAALTLGPLALFPVIAVVGYILAGLGALFVVFGLRTFFRQLSSVEVSDEEIRIQGPVGAACRWRDLDAMSLRYFATRRDRERGWMQLKLKGGLRAVTVDSSIEDFPGIVDSALAAARARRLPLSDDTVANLAALGFADAQGSEGATWAT